MPYGCAGGMRLSKIFDLKDACTEVEFSRLCCHKAHEKRFLLSLVSATEKQRMAWEGRREGVECRTHTLLQESDASTGGQHTYCCVNYDAWLFTRCNYCCLAHGLTPTRPYPKQCSQILHKCCSLTASRDHGHQHQGLAATCFTLVALALRHAGQAPLRPQTHKCHHM